MPSPKSPAPANGKPHPKASQELAVKEQDSRLSIRKDVSQFEARILSAGYPEEVLEDCIFLHQLNLQEFNGSHVLLAHCVRTELQIDKSDNYFYQLLGGKYFRRDKKTGKINGSIDGVREITKALREWATFNAEAGEMPFVDTPTWKQLSDYLDIKREPTEVCKFGAVVGDTGTGKSRMGKRYALLHNHGKTVHIESPSNGTISQFQVKLGQPYGVSVSAPAQERRVRIAQCVRRDSTIFVDNIQKLYNEKNGANQHVLNYLQELQDDTGCTIIMYWVPTFTDKLRNGVNQRYFEQFVGRLGGLDTILELPEYAPMADLRAIQAKMQIAGGQKALDLMKYWSRQPGRLRILYKQLQRARRHATDDGVTGINFAHLESADSLMINPLADEGGEA